MVVTATPPGCKPDELDGLTVTVSTAGDTEADDGVTV